GRPCRARAPRADLVRDRGYLFRAAGIRCEVTRPMGLRQRVRKAIEGPVGQADKLLADLGAADDATKLEILISGWGRGLSAALEELAIAVEDLQARGRPPAEPAPRTRKEVPARAKPGESEPSAPVDLSG